MAFKKLIDQPLKKPLNRAQRQAEVNQTREKLGLKKNSSRAVVAVHECIEIALDRVGGADFFTNLALSKSPEDRRCFANIAARLIPTKVHGDINERVTVQVIKVALDKVVEHDEQAKQVIELMDLHEPAELEQ